MSSLWAYLIIMMLSSSAMAQESGAEESTLLGRTHNVRLGFGIGSTSQGEVDTTTINADLMYRHNFGYVEPAIGLSYSSWSAQPGFPGEDVSYDLSVRGNFVKNEPGRNFIPYAQAGLTFVANEDEDAVAYTTLSGQPLNLALGIQIYPFSEIFAFDIALERSSGTYESTSDNPDSSNEFDSSTTRVRVGYTLSFQ